MNAAQHLAIANELFERLHRCPLSDAQELRTRVEFHRACAHELTLSGILPHDIFKSRDSVQLLRSIR